MEIQVYALPVMNYALQQNGIPIIQQIRIFNPSEMVMEDVELGIEANPSFMLPFTRHIDQLPTGQNVTIIEPQLLMDTEYLAGMTERVSGYIHVELKQSGQVVASADEAITVLAYDEWQGMLIHPEMLVSFVMPNHPEIARIIARATEVLGVWTGDTSMDGYQSQDPNRVLLQAGAIYNALKEEGIAYAVPPASFEEMGQRIRVCDKVLSQKLGTCMDLTLLYVSCLEAIGLNPLLIIHSNHIYAGVWLEDRMFPECVQDDGSLITKRLASGVNEIAVVEATCISTASDHSFDTARRLGEKNLADSAVEAIMDVKRARMSQIRPLPVRVAGAYGWEIHHDAVRTQEGMSAPQRLEDTIHVQNHDAEVDIPKKIQWERKLLDLGLRNTLINLRVSKTQLPILNHSLDALENALASGKEFRILPKPGELSLAEFSFEELNEAGRLEVVQAEFENQRLRSMYTEAELNKSIKGLYRTAKAALEENGANTLYLALGLLRWFENPKSTKARYAPLILLPIEMVRKSAAGGYVIRLRDEEPQMNITLLEKLKQDFGIVIQGLDPLPEDEKGIDIRKVLTIMRKAVMEQKHWDIAEVATIGIFSFTQFVMWNDIRNRTEDLVRNKVVRSLMEGKLAWNAEPLEIGDTVSEEQTLLPMPADASQLYAIQAACSGESFVLHGPPGTGKSQTITSLIAGALAQGKRVLFVAEKMAALEVVQRRLESIGIGAFCMELHSNKSRKRDVLEQLRLASEVTKLQTAEEFAMKAEQIAEARKQLDSYVEQLHTIQPCGQDLYALINEYENLKDAEDIEPFETAWIQQLTRKELEQSVIVLEQMLAAAQEIGHPCGHPLQNVIHHMNTQNGQNIRVELPKAVWDYRRQLQTIQPYANAMQKGITCYKDLESIAVLASHMLCWYSMPKSWSQAPSLQFYDEVQKMAQHFINAEQMRQQLLNGFQESFLTLNGQQLFAEYTTISGKWFLAKSMGMKKLVGVLAPHAKTVINKESLLPGITGLRDYQIELQKANALMALYGKDLESYPDWFQIQKMAAVAKSSAQILYERTGSFDFMHRYCGSIEIKETVSGLHENFAALNTAKEQMEAFVFLAPVQHEDWIAAQLDAAAKLIHNASCLREWSSYMGAADTVRGAGLQNVVDYYESGAKAERVIPAYKKAVYKGLIANAIDQSGELHQFSGSIFNTKIEQYKKMDREWTHLSQQEIYCRLASRVPNFTREAAQSSELGVLQRCIKSGGRGISIRRLFDQIPNLLPRLCPCMLMSPISAAQYLDPKRESFDLVVFDEASQLPTCKAVGVLARGKDAVIVGDPKQMPPTAFFATNTVDEENLDIEDLESILDDCLALNMPQSHLLWHYRSRHESLIAFSNRQFYENKLFTFPSVNDRESKVRLIPVEGVFDRGRTRTNAAEAAAIVEEIKRRSKDPVLSQQSLGVVTFNISQQHLVDDLLNEACVQDPELEKWVYNENEPVFIKNLENVQGDERDVILFSISYGPDENGKVYMNFGPLNRDGGWRRLNVAVTRARQEMLVFSTLRAEQIDMNRTRSEGVAALRSFLEYAEGRTLAIQEQMADVPQQNAFIAESIARELKEYGYTADLQVGRSKYRIDIGVVDPARPDEYILGIMLDGENYKAAKTTRDRELAQIGVLEGLGWEITRVWSLDWWNNREKEIQRLIREIQEAQFRKESTAPETEEEVSDTEIPVYVKTEFEEPEAAVLEYEAAVLPQTAIRAEDFTEIYHQTEIQRRILKVVESEAPISETLLMRRVVQSFGITRAGSRIQNHYNELLSSLQLPSTMQENLRFYWRIDQNPDMYTEFRMNGTDNNRRDVREVPVQEIANAVYRVLEEQVSMAQEDLLRETAKKLGYTRLGDNVIAAMEAGVAYARSKGAVETGNGGTLVLAK